MKRKEMRDIMCHYWCQMSDELFLEQKMDFLLAQMEVNGMLPPAVKANHGFMADEYGMINEWED